MIFCSLFLVQCSRCCQGRCICSIGSLDMSSRHVFRTSPKRGGALQLCQWHSNRLIPLTSMSHQVAGWSPAVHPKIGWWMMLMVSLLSWWFWLSHNESLPFLMSDNETTYNNIWSEVCISRNSTRFHWGHHRESGWSPDTEAAQWAVFDQLVNPAGVWSATKLNCKDQHEAIV